MNLNERLKIGETFTKNFKVTQEDTADFIGNKGIVMLSTPVMIKFMEVTATQIVKGKIPENYRPVGTRIDVQHLKPTPIDMTVTVKAVLTAVEGRKLSYSVEAFNENCKIGFGLYEQHIINLEDFLNKSSD